MIQVNVFNTCQFSRREEKRRELQEKNMKVFVTGGSGFIGSAFIPELTKAGHHVVGLARSEEAATKIKSLGTNVEIIRGDLKNLNVVSEGARNAEGVVHLGFNHDFENYEECCAVDREATIAMLEAIVGSNKPFVYTNGTLCLPPGKLCDENTPLGQDVFSARGITEQAALSYREKGIKVTCVRLSLSVHGKGDREFVPFMIEAAKKSGKSCYINDGQNVWPAIAREDAAELFRIVLEKGQAGSVYHGVAEYGIKIKDIAAVIGEILNLPVVSISTEDSLKHFGFLEFVLSRDNAVSSMITKKELKWEPHGLGLLEDIRRNYSG